VLIAQITDLHVRRKGDLLHHMIHTGRELRRAVDVLNAADPRPALVVATGDLVERGLPTEYARLRKFLDELEAPIVFVPGNHDDRDALRAAFPDHRYLPRTGPLCYAVETRPVRLIALDTTVAPRRGRGGELDADRLSWLDRTLCAAPNVPTVIAMHHPPFDVGVGPVDAPALRGRDEFARIVSAHAQVVRVLCGHVHRFHATTVGGAAAMTVPSTAHQLILERAPGMGPIAVRLEPPAVALHRWARGAMTTEIVRTGERAPERVLRSA
jgi:3',5'-cyclic AMP phosphodiesterase CpdA